MGEPADVREGAQPQLGVEEKREDAYGSFLGASRQHLENVRDLLKEAMLQHDFGRAAALAAALLTAFPADSPAASAEKPDNTMQDELLPISEALAAAHEVLRRAPDAASLTQLHRLLRRAQAWQPSGQLSEAMVLELGWLLITQARDLDEAYDMLSILPQQPKNRKAKRKPIARFARSGLCGLIRYSQWMQAAQEMHAASAARSGAGTEAFDVFEHQPMLWTRTHHAAQDHWRDAVRHLQDALHQLPTSVELAWLLAQLYCAANRPAKALEVAQQLCKAAPMEADAHALLLLLVHLEPPGSTEEQASRVQSHMHLLRCNPGSHAAVQALLDQHATSALEAPLLAEGLCLHLDACNSDEALPAAWVELAQLLLSLGSTVLQSLEQADTARHPAGESAQKQLRQHAQADVSSGRASSAPSSMTHTESEQHTNAAADRSTPPQSPAPLPLASSQALQQWTALQEVLTPRARDWGWQHFEPASLADAEATLEALLAPQAATGTPLNADGQPNAAVSDAATQIEAGVLQLSRMAVAAACMQGVSSPYLARVQSLAKHAACMEAERLLDRAVSTANSLAKDLSCSPCAIAGSETRALGPWSDSNGGYLQLPRSWWAGFPKGLRAAQTIESLQQG